jgi:hypothetical protein
MTPKLHSFALAVGAMIIAMLGDGQALASSFSTIVNANASLTHLNPPVLSVSDPQTASQGEVLAPMSVSSVATIAGFGTVFQHIEVSFASSNQGTFTYHDGLNTAGRHELGFPSSSIGQPVRSFYWFSLTTPGSVDVNWTDIVVANTFGTLFPIFAVIDGTTFFLTGLSSSGIISSPLSAGTHSLAFFDPTNSYGGFADLQFIAEHITSLAFTINGTIGGELVNPAPEPATPALIAVGLFAIGFSLRKVSGSDCDQMLGGRRHFSQERVKSAAKKLILSGAKLPPKR